MNSIASRLLITSCVILAGFVVLTSLAVRHSVHTRAEQALYDRMQGLIYGILGAAEFADNGQLVVNNDELPDQRLTSPVFGTYAEVMSNTGERLWASKSSVSLVPPIAELKVGQWKFNLHGESGGNEVRSLQFAANWATEENQDNIFILHVVNDAVEFNSQLRKFDSTLWVSLLLAALLLLLIQVLVLSWGLRPLAKLGQGLRKIEVGDADLLDTKLPIELKPLANGMNTLIASERNRHERYRNVMDDLAHSLKTPVTVMQNSAREQASQQALPQTVSEQTKRMQDIVAYHLQRASAQGAQALAAPFPLLPLLNRLSATLSKVYTEQKVKFDFRLSANLGIRVHESDLMEIFGNLLDNSCKYGATHIAVSHQKDWIYVDDNGPGFPEEKIDQLSRRGIRADSRYEGQGLGLAVASELTLSYGGEFKLSNRKDGGARVALKFTTGQ